MTTVIEVIWFMVKAYKRKLVFAFYLTIAGIDLLYQITIFSYFKSYMYYPMLNFKYPAGSQEAIRFFDGILGNYFSQFSVAATAVLIAVLKLKKYWYFIFAAIYCAIEELFKYLDIYKQNWYQTWMTLVGVVILIWITDKMYKKALQGMGNVWKYITVFLGVFSLYNCFIDVPILMFDIFSYSYSIFPDPSISTAVIYTFDSFLFINVVMTAYFLKLKWYWHALVIVFLEAVYYYAWKFEYIVIKKLSFLVYTTGYIMVIYLLIFIVDRLYEQEKGIGAE
jgi:hypothetical protein